MSNRYDIATGKKQPEKKKARKHLGPSETPLFDHTEKILFLKTKCSEEIPIFIGNINLTAIQNMRGDIDYSVDMSFNLTQEQAMKLFKK